MVSDGVAKTGFSNRRSGFMNQKRRNYIAAYIMIFPLVSGMLIFYIIPFFQTFYNSFLEMGAFGPATWIGLDNYKSMLEDKTLWQAFRNTLVYAFVSVPVTVTFSIFLAVLLNTQIRGRSVYRTLFFLPCVTMPAAIAMVWMWLYNSNYGLINSFLNIFGIKGVAWTTNTKTAIYSIIVVVIWSSVGRYMVILLAGLQGIPDTYYAAASIDGAGTIWKFFFITLPLLTPTIFFVIIMALISTFQIFDVIFMIVPKDSIAAESTQSLVFLFYRAAFVYNEKGYASAIAILIFLLVLTVTYIQMKLQNKWVFYD